MLSNCSVSVSVAEGRYTWRHDSILYTLLQYLCQLKNYGFNIYGDLEGYCKTSELFHSFRPDIVLVKDDTIYILELTCCFETNTEKSRNFKMNKYIDIKNDCTRRFRHCKKIFIEITSLGLVTTHIENLNSIFKETDINYKRMIAKCMEVAMRASFYIYIRRNKRWTCCYFIVLLIVSNVLL